MGITVYGCGGLPEHEGTQEEIEGKLQEGLESNRVGGDEGRSDPSDVLPCGHGMTLDRSGELKRNGGNGIASLWLSLRNFKRIKGHATGRFALHALLCICAVAALTKDETTPRGW